MQLIPVIDLKNGVAVHARAGDRANYQPLRAPLLGTNSSSPVEVAEALLAYAPFGMLYVADLNAIVDGSDAHEPVLQAMCERLQRTGSCRELWIDAGTRDYAGRLRAHFSPQNLQVFPVIGSESLSQADLDNAKLFGDEAVLSLDFKRRDFLGPASLLIEPKRWPQRVIIMELARVGSSGGPNVERLQQMRTLAAGRAIYAAGGVRGEEDLSVLQAAGVQGCLIATAVHNGQLTASQLRAWLEK